MKTLVKFITSGLESKRFRAMVIAVITAAVAKQWGVVAAAIATYITGETVRPSGTTGVLGADAELIEDEVDD